MHYRSMNIAIAAGLAIGTLMTANAGLAAGAQQQLQTETIYVMPDELGLVGPDGKHHDTFLPSSFVLKAGAPVQITFINYDDMIHTFTSSKLGLNVNIKAGTHVQGSDGVTPVETTITFTPVDKGQFRWNCNFPCDKGAGKGWAMKSNFDGRGADGFMAGYVEVI